MEELLAGLGSPFGVLAESGADQLTIIARPADVAVGDLFLLPCRRGPERFHVFRAGLLGVPDGQRIQLKGVMLGYAQRDGASGDWRFHRPRRLPQPPGDVYHVDPASPQAAGVVRTLLSSQLGESGLYLGNLLVGEQALAGVGVYLPVEALSQHIGLFGRAGCGKSNLIMVLLHSVLCHNRSVGPRASVFATDPDNGYHSWHAGSGGSDDTQGLERRIRLSRADAVPDDLVSVMDLSEPERAFAREHHALFGEGWIGRLLLGDTGDEGAAFLPSTVQALRRRVGFLRHGQTRLFTRFDPDAGLGYESGLPDVICALEKGRVIVVDTSLMAEREQHLLTTIVVRVLFALRKALRRVEDAEGLRVGIHQALGNDPENGLLGMQSLADELVARLDRGELPYRDGKQVRRPEQLPLVNVVVEEAAGLLNPERMRGGSVFRDVSRQGGKFGIGLSVVSRQVSVLDKEVRTQLGTQLILSLGNDAERQEVIRNAPTDLLGYERELQVLGKGQVLVAAAYRDVPLAVQVPEYDARRAEVSR